ncbi:MAG: hypothetical protein ABIP49_09275 [Lysobacterales bacterium]
MSPIHNPFFIAGGVLSALAALLHLGCIVFGAPWYRFLGAGEHMARMAEAGSPYPARLTLLVAGMLMVWSAYAFSGGGVLPRLPLLRVALCAITLVYLARAVAFPAIMPMFPGNTFTFWLASSAICAGIGIVHLIGLRQAWSQL